MATKIFHSTLCRRLQLFAFLVAMAMMHALPSRAAQDDAADKVRACFEGPASEAAAPSANSDDLTRHKAEMAAGKQCEKLAADIIQACLDEVDATDDDDVKDYYPCIGIVANPCIDSDWAQSEFRSVVCIGTEERVWLDILHAKLDVLKAVLDDKRKQRLETMRKSFFEYRNAKCGLGRDLREGNEPYIAYGACTTETAARLAIDLREMAQTAGEEKAEPQQDEEQASDQPEAESEEKVLGSKAHPVRADNPAGEHAYLERLRCPDGTAPSFGRQGSVGYGGYGHIVDLYAVRCGDAGESHKIYMDMYFPGYVESTPVPGFTLVED